MSSVKPKVNLELFYFRMSLTFTKVISYFAILKTQKAGGL